MALPWVRLDATIGHHDKILALLSDPSPKRWQAAFSYVCALGWAGEHGTDGRVPAVALPFIHGNPATSRLLVKYELWKETLTGYEIHNYAMRQQLNDVSEAKKAAQSAGAKKGNCQRFHGPDCGCWKESA